MALAFILLSNQGKAESTDTIAEPIVPLTEKTPEITDKVFLGAILFHEKKLSTDNTISCASCHNLQRGGMDGLERSVGVRGNIGEVNAPTVFNSSFNFSQFWNGRAKTLLEQVEGPLHNPKEMGSTWDQILEKLKSDPKYTALFKKNYADGITAQNIKDSIISFEKTLVTPRSRFDQYLSGNTTVLSDLEKLGYERFKSYGCVACHQGMNVGGNMYQTMGVMGNYFKDRGTPLTDADLGRYSITKQERDKFLFRVPSLRNVELTAPYFHDGSAKTLEKAVEIMGRYQLGKRLSKPEIDSLVAFLKTLTGEKPKVLSILQEIPQ